MRILLDECVNPRLKEAFPAHDVSTTHEMGWNNSKDSTLLRLAQESFDVFVTIDRNLEFQQNLARINLAIVVVETLDNQMDSYRPLFAQLREAVQDTKPGSVAHVPGAQND
jgi:predicted nuclease of predicted toxin-antitoxin system